MAYKLKEVEHFSSVFKLDELIKDNTVFIQKETGILYFPCPCKKGGYVKVKGWNIIEKDPLSIEPSFSVAHGDQWNCHFHIKRGELVWV